MKPKERCASSGDSLGKRLSNALAKSTRLFHDECWVNSRDQFFPFSFGTGKIDMSIVPRSFNLRNCIVLNAGPVQHGSMRETLRLFFPA